MADAGIKRSVLYNRSLPLLYSPIIYVGVNGEVTERAGYLFRYRIISEDRSRISHWSPLQIASTIEAGSATGQVLINPSSNVINVTWGNEVQPEGYVIERDRFDIFVGFDDNEPTFDGTAYGKTYSFIKSGSTNVRVIVQIESFRRARLAYLEIFDSGVLSLV